MDVPSDTPSVIPDDAIIRQLDGPALRELAWEFGLAETFEHGHRMGNTFFVYRDGKCYPWKPHANLAQAREVFFDYLPCDGWQCTYNSATQIGQMTALYDVGQSDLLRIPCHYSRVPGAENDTEAMALLRCACLAMAHIKREESTHGMA